MVDGTLGSFMGVTSKTLDKGALEVAQAAERQGIGVDEIYDKTGFFKGADNRWRYEIDDSTAKFNEKWADNPSPTQMQTGMKIVKLPDVIDHPELFKAYPKLKDIQVIYDNNFRGVAEFSGEAIRLGKNPYNPGVPAFKDKGVLMHEVQHAIQDMEGFAKGGAPLKAARGEYRLKHEDDINKLRPTLIDLLGKERKGEILSPEEQAKLDYLKVVFDKYVEYQKAGDKKAFENYEALAGEVEARNVQHRVDLTPEQRMKYNPADSEEIARSEQLVRHSATSTTPYLDRDLGYFTSYLEKAPSDFKRHLESPEKAKFRLGQLLRDKASSKKAGVDVNSSDYMFYNAQIRELREYLKSIK
jgi:hypothetical protein